MDQELPLSRHVVFASSNLDETKGHVQRELAARSLEFTTEDRRLDARLHLIPQPWVTPMYLRYGGDVVKTTGDASHFLVHVPISGQVVAANEHLRFAATPGHASIASPTEPVALQWSRDSEAMLFRIDRTALEAELTDLLHSSVDEPLRFDVAMVSRRADSWATMARFFAEQLDRVDGIVSDPLVGAPMERALLRGLLLSQPHNYSDQLNDNGPTPVPAHIQAARAAIDELPEQALTAASLARQVGVSARSLQAGFRAHVGLSPMQYLRAVRMRRVRDELLAGDARRATISAIAHRWGFTHLGRFAQDYRSRYGESPSQTLRVSSGSHRAGAAND